MAFSVIPLPSEWTVPASEGVPALRGPTGNRPVAAAASTALGQIVADIDTRFQAQQWGLYDQSGQSVLTAAHVWQIDFHRDYDITTVPLENGEFAAYNKVARPWTCVLSFLCDGSEDGGNGSLSDIALTSLLGSLNTDGGLRVRQGFFETLERIVADTKLYDVRMPERPFHQGNVTGYRFRRRVESGVTLPVAEVIVQQVRSARVLQMAASRSVSAAPSIATGVVQPTLFQSGAIAASAPSGLEEIL